jgi:hypothetical protein
MGFLDLLDSKLTNSCRQPASILEACCLLNDVEARLWMDSSGNGFVGIWACVDTDAVRQAAALVFHEAKVLHLEDRQTPALLKGQSKRIASIEDAARGLKNSKR